MSFFEIFQPGLRHLREERERQQSLVTEPKHGARGPLGIDLDSGKASFTMPTAPEADQPDGDQPDGAQPDGAQGGHER